MQAECVREMFWLYDFVPDSLMCRDLWLWRHLEEQAGRVGSPKILLYFVFLCVIIHIFFLCDLNETQD